MFALLDEQNKPPRGDAKVIRLHWRTTQKGNSDDKVKRNSAYRLTASKDCEWCFTYFKKASFGALTRSSGKLVLRPASDHPALLRAAW